MLIPEKSLNLCIFNDISFIYSWTITWTFLGTVDTKLLRLGYQSPWWGWWVFGLRLHRPFVKDTYHGAQSSLFCALDNGLTSESNSGRYFANCREARPSGRAMVVKDCKKLWDLSEHYLGLKSSSQSEMLWKLNILKPKNHDNKSHSMFKNLH